MGICGRISSSAQVCQPCDPAIWLLNSLKWVRGLGGIPLFLSQTLLSAFCLQGGWRVLMRSHHVDLCNWEDGD